VATEHDDPELEEALAIVRDDDASTPGLLLAQRRIAGRLFGEAAPGLGRFRVLERLGGGGMGVVYAAYDPQLDRGVALKTVHVPEGSGEVALREAKALAKVSHPNIVPVFDVGFEAGHVYIVMELIRGDTLRAWVFDHPGHQDRNVILACRPELSFQDRKLLTLPESPGDQAWICRRARLHLRQLQRELQLQSTRS